MPENVWAAPQAQRAMDGSSTRHTRRPSMLDGADDWWSMDDMVRASDGRACAAVSLDRDVIGAPFRTGLL